MVIGQGYVGLPLAMRAVDSGFRVVGLDFDASRIESLAAGKSYVEDVSDQQIARALSSGVFKPTREYEDAAGFDFAVITVPTPLKERQPDLSFIISSLQSIAPFVTKNCTVVLESTTYPGTTEELVVPTLEQLTGLISGYVLLVFYIS